MLPFRYSILRTTAAALMLTGCSAPADSPAGWWDNAANRTHFRREWSAPRPTLSDTTIHRFVRSLLAQRKKDPRLPDTSTSFWLATTLFNTDPILCDPTHYGQGYLTCKGPDLTGKLLRELVENKVLNPNDTVFMKHQLLSSTSFRLRAEMLPSYRIVSADTLWAINQRLINSKSSQRKSALKLFAARYSIDDYSGNAVSYFSLPLFSRDLQTVIIDVNNCFLAMGMLEGSGATLVLHWENRRWVLVKKLERWIT